MPDNAPPQPPSSIVAALRAGGCVFAEDEARLLTAAATDADDLADKAARRAAGYPLEHLLGWAEFAGHRVTLDPGVFVPRRRTEFMVRRAVAHGRPGAVVLDLCCGSGAVGLAVAAALDAAELHAADLDPAAVRCARRNIAPYGGRAHHGDLFGPLPAALRGRVDVLVANVPYVPTAQVGLLPAEAREHEALSALDGGPDGLDVLRRVAAAAPGWLAPGGALFFETGRDQARPALAALRTAGLRARADRDEDAYATVVTGVRPPEPEPEREAQPEPEREAQPEPGRGAGPVPEP